MQTYLRATLRGAVVPGSVSACLVDLRGAERRAYKPAYQEASAPAIIRRRPRA